MAGVPVSGGVISWEFLGRAPWSMKGHLEKYYGDRDAMPVFEVWNEWRLCRNG